MTSSERPAFAGWRMIGALSVAIVVAYGVTFYAYGPLLPSMQHSLHASRGTLSGAYSLGSLVGGVVGMVVGRHLDRHGVRPVLLLGTALTVGGLLLVAAARSVLDLYLAWGLVVGAATAIVFYDPVFLLVSRWFERLRGRAMGILTFGGGFASIIFIPLVTALDLRLGWRATWVVLAAIMLVVTTPIYAFLAHSRPEDLGQWPDGRRPDPAAATMPRSSDSGWSRRAALTSRIFLLLTAAYFAGNLAIYAMVVHLVPVLRWAGQPAETAAATAALLGISALPGRLLLNMLSDLAPRPVVLGSTLVLMGVAVTMLTFVHHGGFLYLFVVIYGLGNGCFSPLKATIMADYFAGPSFGSILSLQSAVLTIGTAAGPALVGTLYDRSGGYTAGLGLIAICLLVAAATVIAAPRLAGAPLPARSGAVVR